MLLNNKWVNNKIKEEIKQYNERNENEDTTTQNLGTLGKQYLEGNSEHYRAVKKQEKAKTN